MPYSQYGLCVLHQMIDSLGPLEYVLNTPSHHRVHHGRNRYCIDKNYAGTLIIWDRMFGEPQFDLCLGVWCMWSFPRNKFAGRKFQNMMGLSYAKVLTVGSWMCTSNSKMRGIVELLESWLISSFDIFHCALISGTFAPEREQVVYGLVHPLSSWDTLYTQVLQLTARTVPENNPAEMAALMQLCWDIISP